eukprot:2127666-Rhodomonas_salina.3
MSNMLSCYGFATALSGTDGNAATRHNTLLQLSIVCKARRGRSHTPPRPTQCPVPYVLSSYAMSGTDLGLAATSLPHSSRPAIGPSTVCTAIILPARYVMSGTDRRVVT